jgi:hypothetical protein
MRTILLASSTVLRRAFSVLLKKGILLVSFGSATYAKYAYNMAYSIKFFSQDLPVFLYTDGIGMDQVDNSVFDKIERYDFKPDDPGVNKTILFDITPFEKTIYLDVDGVCLKDISPLFNELEEQKVFAQVIDYGKKEDKITYSEWADNATVWNHFKLKEEAVLCGTQTSIIYFDKSKEAKAFFKDLKKNYSKPLPKEKYLLLWGFKKHHPDELYYSGTMAQHDIVPDKRIQPIFFPDKVESVTKILSDYYVLSQFGGQSLVRPYAHDLYNRHLSAIMRSKGKDHLFKSQNLYKNKMIVKK